MRGKLDGVGPIDNRPSTNQLHNFVKKMWHITCDIWQGMHDPWHLTHDNRTCDTWHMTLDMWHLTHDTGHVTPDTWHVTPNAWHVTPDTWKVGGGEPSLKCSAPLLLRFGNEGLMEIFKIKIPTKWMNYYKAVYRIAPATTGLLITHLQNITKWLKHNWIQFDLQIYTNHPFIGTQPINVTVFILLDSWKVLKKSLNVGIAWIGWTPSLHPLKIY